MSSGTDPKAPSDSHVDQYESADVGRNGSPDYFQKVVWLLKVRD